MWKDQAVPIFRIANKISYNQPGSPGVNIMHVRADAEGASELLEEALSSIAGFYTSIASVLAPGVRVDVAESVIQDPLGSRVVIGVPSAAVLGASASVQAPALLCICASWKTSIATRSGRGRTFIGPLEGTAGDSDGSTSNDKRLTVLEAAQVLIQESSAANGWGFGILSLKDGLLRDVVGVTISDQLSYLSSRRN